MDLPTGVDLELPSGLTTLLSLSDDSVNEARNSTTISDPLAILTVKKLKKLTWLKWDCSANVEGCFLSKCLFKTPKDFTPE